MCIYIYIFTKNIYCRYLCTWLLSNLDCMLIATWVDFSPNSQASTLETRNTPFIGADVVVVLAPSNSINMNIKDKSIKHPL